jgi:hypothetical protein
MIFDISKMAAAATTKIFKWTNFLKQDSFIFKNESCALNLISTFLLRLHACQLLRVFFFYQYHLGTYKVRNEIETKRNETKRNQRKRNETKRNETKSTKTKRNETKSTVTLFRLSDTLLNFARMGIFISEL